MKTPTTQHPFPTDHAAIQAEAGYQWKFKFANGYGASVVRGPYTYGGPEGLWELAVLDADDHLTYETAITSDVVGHLSEAEVVVLLDQIAALP